MLPECLLDTGERGLDLDDEQRADTLVPGEEIDGAALAVDRIRHFEPDLPAEASKQRDDRSNQSCVTLVNEPVEMTSAPVQLNGELGIERSGDSPQVGERDPLEMAALDQ